MATKLDNFILILGLFLFVNVCWAQQEYCYSEDSDRVQARRYSTKTAYQIVHGIDRRLFNVPNCEAKRFWMFARHGTRLPGAKSIDELSKLVDFRNVVLQNYGSGRRDKQPGQLCTQDLEALRNWNWDRNITAQYENSLTIQGWNDLKFLGLDYQRSFGNVIDLVYTRNRFRFGHTDTQRTIASFQAFCEGLFGPNTYNRVYADNGTDHILRPYDYCKDWKKRSDNAKSKDSEYTKFIESEFYKSTLSQISTRLGFKYTLSAKQVDNIWDMCRYDQAWNLEGESDWCVSFTPQQVEVLEYAEDLKYYYKAGYGSELNEKIMCSAVQDMLQFIQRNDSRRVSAYFGHSAGIQLLLAALGFGKDRQTLRADNFYEMKNRKWRTSSLTPFAANLVVVTYDCPNEADPNKVQFFLNEKPVNDVDFCNIGLCDLSRVLEHYKQFLDADCQKYYCSTNSATSFRSICLSAMLSLVLVTQFWKGIFSI